MRFNGHKYEVGFTFIELVVVMVVTSVVIGIAGPQLARFYKGIKMDSALRQMRIFLAHARETSLSERKLCRVVVDNGWRRLSLHMQDDPLGNPDKFVPLDGRMANYEMLPDIEIDEIKVNGAGKPWGSEFSVDVHPMVSYEEVAFLLKDMEGEKAAVRMTAGGGRVLIERKEQ